MCLVYFDHFPWLSNLASMCFNVVFVLIILEASFSEAANLVPISTEI